MSDDLSNRNVYSISQGETHLTVDSPTPSKIDNETVNLINWLAEEQGISPEVALKKAIAIAAYIHDLTAKQGGKLLVQHKDNSVRRIDLK
ncbi:hypothetical protein [Pseudanabaena mucicola]|uniref:Uncharacterized protein n=1 Tax=Pseudanabaena mucicola FACHB-723 TaxID=2692860 RepID=A0ABR7ZYI7_9CYAN|nr:hypothetical protein [Pseudanabaena mucicola]MBD2188987.1 hypothetical protein [Pseudanabaena mucicola FACHB-723]